MPGSIGLDTNPGAKDGTTANVTTDENGNVTITISPKKDDGAPNTAVPPSTQLKGKGTVSGTVPGPGEKSGKFEVRVGDPLYVQIECKTNCDVIISIYPNADGSGNPIWTVTFPSTNDTLKVMLVALLKQAATDAKPKPAAASNVPAKAAPVKSPAGQKSVPPKKAPGKNRRR